MTLKKINVELTNKTVKLSLDCSAWEQLDWEYIPLSILLEGRFWQVLRGK